MDKTTKSMLHKTLAVIATILALVLAVGIVGCSSGASKSSKGETLVNGYTVKEYNADIDNLSRILSKAKSLKGQLDAMGDPNRFTTQDQVNKYNNLVDQYNTTANEYNSAAKAFSKKYGSTIDGAGTKPTDPNNIDLPKKR